MEGGAAFDAISDVGCITQAAEGKTQRVGAIFEAGGGDRCGIGLERITLQGIFEEVFQTVAIRVGGGLGSGSSQGFDGCPSCVVQSGRNGSEGDVAPVGDRAVESGEAEDIRPLHGEGGGGVGTGRIGEGDMAGAADLGPEKGEGRGAVGVAGGAGERGGARKGDGLDRARVDGRGGVGGEGAVGVEAEGETATAGEVERVEPAVGPAGGPRVGGVADVAAGGGVNVGVLGIGPQSDPVGLAGGEVYGGGEGELVPAFGDAR